MSESVKSVQWRIKTSQAVGVKMQMVIGGRTRQDWIVQMPQVRVSRRQIDMPVFMLEEASFHWIQKKTLGSLNVQWFIYLTNISSANFEKYFHTVIINFLQFIDLKFCLFCIKPNYDLFFLVWSLTSTWPSHLFCVSWWSWSKCLSRKSVLGVRKQNQVILKW